MKKLIILVLSLLLIVPAANLSGQSRKGFKLLTKRQYEKARKAFLKDQNHPWKTVVAKYGLSQCIAKQSRSLNELKPAFDLAKEAQSELTTLTKTEKRKLRRYKGLNENKINIQLKNIQRKALKGIQKSKSIVELDTFVENFAPVQSAAQRDFQKTRIEAIRHTIRHGKDYTSLSSLAKNHYALVGKTNYRFQRTLQDKLLDTYIREQGIYALDNFVKDHPGHAFSQDCWVEEFTTAIKEKTGIGLVRFLSHYPLSTLDIHASSIFKIKTRQGTDLPSGSSLTLDDERQIQSLLKEWEIESELSLDTLSAEFPQRVKTYISTIAPARRAYKIMRETLQKYLVSKKWREAEELILFAAPLFPDEQPEDCDTRFYYYSTKEAWFDIAIPIIKREAGSIELNLVPGINSDQGEQYSPVISADGRTLFFAATGKENNIGGEDIFVSKYNANARTWGKPILVRALSSGGDEAPLSITADGNEMLLFKDGKLHLSKLTSKGWSSPHPASEQINAFPWIGRATLSADGQVILFSASLDPEEIYAESNIDIYVSERDKDGNWQPPVPLNGVINTQRQERSPFLALDKETLYFSSNGHDGLGGMDVFMSKRIGDGWLEWSRPVNLGKEINTLEDDWSYNYSVGADGETIYLSADDFHSGLSKIYSSGLPKFAAAKTLTPILARIKRPKNLPLETTVVVTDSQGNILEKIKTRPDGSFTILANPDSTISFYIEDDRLYQEAKTIDVKKYQESDSAGEIVMEGTSKKEVYNGEKPIPMDPIHFEHNSHILSPKSNPQLKRLYELHGKEAWKIEINGHTDDEGSRPYNKQLSLKRARSVREYLNQLGVPIQKMTTKGSGFEFPVATNETEEGRARNRRVEIKVFMKKKE